MNLQEVLVLRVVRLRHLFREFQEDLVDRLNLEHPQSQEDHVHPVFLVDLADQYLLWVQ